jgi:hypothetical protein
MKKIVSKTLLTLATLTASITFQPMEAQASASGCTSFSGGGLLCGQVQGSSLDVDWVSGNFTSISPICNWHFAVRFYDRNNREYKTVNSSDHTSCNVSGSFKWNPSGNYRAKPGRVCIGLYKDFSREVDRACFSIVG